MDICEGDDQDGGEYGKPPIGAFQRTIRSRNDSAGNGKPNQPEEGIT